jgi:cystathionine beta-lyase/cystathionine gamma-synthase
MRTFGVSPDLVRLSLGLESAEDLWADMEAALGANRS